ETVTPVIESAAFGLRGWMCRPILIGGQDGRPSQAPELSSLFRSRPLCEVPQWDPCGAHAPPLILYRQIRQGLRWNVRAVLELWCVATELADQC
ncbi:hypothetical protein, partial [Streptomyces sp. NPDC059071]|uniref:hypothetical protein n=1 Tax=Streptomyces sp. NPDC059071 TaxID=3346714 RepID=UPI0036D0B67D